MQPGDRYPQALAIARERLREELDRTKRQSGMRPRKDSLEYDELESSIVPPYPSDAFPDKWRKLIPAQPSWTVTAHLSKDGYSHIHYDDDQARTITVREAARLQSFPDGYQFHGSMGERFKHIGNAVPPLMSQRIAETMIEILLKSERRGAGVARGEDD
jgi:DNA (cytosine-5)-methyltransferase 1